MTPRADEMTARKPGDPGPTEHEIDRQVTVRVPVETATPRPEQPVDKSAARLQQMIHAAVPGAVEDKQPQPVSEEDERRMPFWMVVLFTAVVPAFFLFATLWVKDWRQEQATEQAMNRQALMEVAKGLKDIAASQNVDQKMRGAILEGVNQILKDGMVDRAERREQYSQILKPLQEIVSQTKPPVKAEAPTGPKVITMSPVPKLVATLTSPRASPNKTLTPIYKPGWFNPTRTEMTVDFTGTEKAIPVEIRSGERIGLVAANTDLEIMPRLKDLNECVVLIGTENEYFEVEPGWLWPKLSKSDGPRRVLYRLKSGNYIFGKKYEFSIQVWKLD